MTRISTGTPELPDPLRGRHWVFHRGALGDSILLWPMLRHWQRRGLEVTLITDSSKARLAERELGIQTEDAERFNKLWIPDSQIDPIRLIDGITAYLDPGEVWLTNARRMFPGAAITLKSERPDRTHALWYAMPALNPCDPGAIVLHIGAGSEHKRWPLDHWLTLAELITTKLNRTVKLIAGEVEYERLPDRDRFTAAGGTILFTLEDLAAAIRSARIFIAADSGPGHLAAQLGIPTVSLFGPTDPALWSPVGPAVIVLAPPAPCPMHWLGPDAVLTAIRDLSRSVFGRSV